VIDTLITIVYDLYNCYTIPCITHKRIYGIIYELNTCQQTILLPLSNCLRAIKNFISGRNMTKALIDNDDDNDDDDNDDDDDDEDILEQCGEFFSR